MVEQTPIVRNSSFDKEAYRGLATAQMRILKDYMKVGGLSVYSRIVTLDNGVVITCQKSFNREDIFISVPQVPYTEVIVKVVSGAFLFDHKQLAGFSRLEFNANNTEADGWAATYEVGPDVYGNTDWKGKGGVLCWLGVASRHFEIDATKSDSGYMVFDEDVGIENPISYYTPFGPDIYAEGAVLDTVPAAGLTSSKVLGAARIEGKLVCVVGRNYRNALNPDGEVGGFFDEVLVKDGAWQRVAYQRGSRPVANWFFNASGTEAQCVTYGKVKKITISADVVDEEYSFSAVFEQSDACEGFVAESIVTVDDGPYGVGLTYPPDDIIHRGSGDPADYTASQDDKIGGGKSSRTITATTEFDCIVAVDYIGDTEVVAQASYKINDKSEYSTDQYSIMGIQEFFWNEPNASTELSASYPNSSAGVGDCPGATGCAPFTWSASGPATINPDTGCITAITCATGSVGNIVWTVTDALGHTASTPAVTLSGPQFGWYLKESYSYAKPAGTYWGRNNCPDYPSWGVTVISGSIKTIYSGYYGITGSSCSALTACSGDYGSSSSPWSDGPDGTAPANAISPFMSYCPGYPATELDSSAELFCCYPDGVCRCYSTWIKLTQSKLVYEWRCP